MQQRGGLGQQDLSRLGHVRHLDGVCAVVGAVVAAGDVYIPRPREIIVAVFTRIALVCMTGDVISFPVVVDYVAPKLENNAVSVYEEDAVMV